MSTQMSRFSVASQIRRQAADLVPPCDVCAVREFAACAPLNPEEQRRLVSIMTTVKVAPYRAIFEEADPAEHVYNVTAGAIKIYKLLSDGRRQITGFLFPGDFLGLTHNETYAYSAEALIETTMCRFPRRKLEALLDDLPKLEQRLLGMASHELAAAQDQMMLLGRKTARERVVSFLLMLSNSAVRHGQAPNPVEFPMTRADIADYLGLTVETISRTLTQLDSAGLIRRLDDGHVQLAKVEPLRAIAAAGA